jgi:hypothetical protein
MRHTISGMQTMQLLALSGVTMAAGAMVSLSFAVSPPLTLVPPLPVPIKVHGNLTSHQQQAIETVGAAIDDRFEQRRPTATDDLPPAPAPRRDLLEGLVGGFLTPALAQDAPEVAQVEQPDLAAGQQPAQQASVTVVSRELPARASDVCTRHGLRRIEYTQNRHRYWRCAAGRRG